MNVYRRDFINKTDAFSMFLCNHKKTSALFETLVQSLNISLVLKIQQKCFKYCTVFQV